MTISFETKQQNLADLAVALGVNLQEGQTLIINAPIDCADFAHKVAAAAFDRGAADVAIRYNDERLSRMRYDHADLEALTTIPAWQKARMDSYVDDQVAVISIYADDPDVMAGVDVDRVKAASNAAQAAAKKYHEAVMNDRIRWCVISIPTVGWARKVFPDIPKSAAVEQLWNAIFETTRTNLTDPAAAWHRHNASFEEKVRFLNNKQFDAFVYKNALGTNITVGMPKNHIWAGGSEIAEDGIAFFPNIPTEEIFSAPDKTRVNGTLAASHPLVYNGQLIDHFALTFKDGKVVGYHAEQGFDALKSLVEANPGSNMLGEISFVPYDSPIQNLGILFYNTLFDENASCHFALGAAYPTCIEGGQNMSETELAAAGLNISTTHVDFMVGSEDLSIVRLDAEGNETPIFVDGNWADPL